MRKSYRLATLFVLLTFVVSSACSVFKEPPRKTLTPSSTETAQALPTTTPTFAPTDTPAPTPTPTNTPTPLPPTPPRLAYFTPARGEEQSLAGTVVLTFDQPMDAAAEQAAFTLYPQREG